MVVCKRSNLPNCYSVEKTHSYWCCCRHDRKLDWMQQVEQACFCNRFLTWYALWKSIQTFYNRINLACYKTLNLLETLLCLICLVSKNINTNFEIPFPIIILNIYFKTNLYEKFKLIFKCWYLSLFLIILLHNTTQVSSLAKLNSNWQVSNFPKNIIHKRITIIGTKPWAWNLSYTK